MEVILAISSDSGEEVSVDSLPCGRWENRRNPCAKVMEPQCVISSLLVGYFLILRFVHWLIYICTWACHSWKENML